MPDALIHGHGVTYDAGCLYPTATGVTWKTRPTFHPAQVDREMKVIHDDLNCNAVRIVGSEQDALPSVVEQLHDKINAFLAEAVGVVRDRFGGPVTYASLSVERVDWTPFYIVGLDFFPNLVNGEYVGATAALKDLASNGKPVAITEIACGTYRGSAANPGAANAILVYDQATGIPVGISGEHVRDEAEQADYLTGLLGLFEEQGVHSAFACTFAQFQLPGDLDIASWGIVRMLEAGHGDTFHDVPWEPKAAFWALAAWFDRSRARGRGG